MLRRPRSQTQRRTAPSTAPPASAARCAHFSAWTLLVPFCKSVPNLPNHERDRVQPLFRSLLLNIEQGLSNYISGVILHWETLFQKDAAGNQMVDLITAGGMIPGIKLDGGYKNSYIAVRVSHGTTCAALIIFSCWLVSRVMCPRWMRYVLMQHHRLLALPHPLPLHWPLHSRCIALRWPLAGGCRAPRLAHSATRRRWTRGWTS